MDAFPLPVSHGQKVLGSENKWDLRTSYETMDL